MFGVLGNESEKKPLFRRQRPRQKAKMIRIESVLVADEIEQECLDVLESKGIHVEKKPKLAKSELIEELKRFDAVLVRSATKVKKEN